MELFTPVDGLPDEKAGPHQEWAEAVVDAFEKHPARVARVPLPKFDVTDSCAIGTLRFVAKGRRMAVHKRKGQLFIRKKGEREE
jgi:hypothetical protein